ncbi:LysR family transcriptional regulator [Rhizobium binxianense]
MNISIRQMETFRLFAQTRSVTETARILRISQPAISQTLKEIELQLGFALSVRIGGRTRLTDEAMLVLPQIEQVLVQMRTLRNQAVELRDARLGSVAIAAAPTLCAWVIPEAIERFRIERQHVRFRIESYSGSEVQQQVKHERVNLGFAFVESEENGVISEPMLRTSVVCLTPKGHPLSKEPAITLKMLKNETVIIPDRQTFAGFALRDRLESNTEGLDVLDTNRSISALHLVRHGLGVALTHPLVLHSEIHDEIEAIPFEPDIPVTLRLLYSRHRPVSRTVMRFVAKIKEVFVDVERDMRARNIPCEILF